MKTRCWWSRVTVLITSQWYQGVSVEEVAEKGERHNNVFSGMATVMEIDRANRAIKEGYTGIAFAAMLAPHSSWRNDGSRESGSKETPNHLVTHCIIHRNLKKSPANRLV
jgi:hypothetical protein